MTIRKLIYLCLFVLLACSGRKENVETAKTGNDLSKFQLSEINGNSIDLTQFEGKAVFINVWATWCKPCIQEMPTIESMQRRMVENNVVILLASSEETEQIEGFIGRHTYDFHYVRVENMEELNIQALPTTYIFNLEGKKKFAESGYRNWDDVSNIELIKNIINDHEE